MLYVNESIYIILPGAIFLQTLDYSTLLLIIQVDVSQELISDGFNYFFMKQLYSRRKNRKH